MLVLYSRPGCLFCKQVADLFIEEAIPHQTVVITDVERQNELIGKTDTKSFPLVFLGKRFVGGFTHVVYLHSMGRLKELLDAQDPSATSLAPDAEPGKPTTAVPAKTLGALPLPVRPTGASPVKSTAPHGTRPTTAPARPSAVQGARDEIAGFARWGEYLKKKGKPAR